MEVHCVEYELVEVNHSTYTVFKLFYSHAPQCESIERISCHFRLDLFFCFFGSSISQSEIQLGP